LNSYQAKFIEYLINKIVSYQISEIVIDQNTSTIVVRTIFETINSTGMKLTVFDLLNAKCYPSKFLLRKQLDSAFDVYSTFIDYDPDKDDLMMYQPDAAL
jgi:uncharacterized protein with ParB-like and HNH nuclease domain